MIEWARFRPLLKIATLIIAFILLVQALLAADRFCYEQALAIEIDVQDGITLLVDGQIIPLQTTSQGSIGIPATISFAPHDPVIHEYQLDGTKSTGVSYLDPAYLHQIALSPYYRFNMDA